MKRIISVLLAAAIILSLTACSITNGNAEFSIGVSEGINTFDPILAETDAERIVSQNCFEGLLRFDSNGKINLAGATAYTIEKNGLSYIFKLNPNAKYHISTETEELIKSLGIEESEETIIAEDYIFGFEKFKKTSNKLDIIKEMSSTDDFTLEISLSEKDSDFLYKLASLPLYPCQKTFCEAAADLYGTTPSTVLFNGPYYIDDYSAGETVLKRCRDYNGNVQIRNKQVTLFTTGLKDTITERFNSGDYNLYVAESHNPAIKAKEPSSVSYESVWGIAFNCKSKIGSVKAIRDILFGSIEAPYEIPLPSFALEKTSSLFPGSFTVCDTVYSEFETPVLTHTADSEKAVKALDALQKKYKVSSYAVSFAAPYDMKADAEKIVADWQAIFGNKIKVTITLYNKDDAPTIAEEGAYDIAIMPLFNENNTIYSVYKSISSAPCYYENEKADIFSKIPETIASKNAETYLKAEKHLIENNVFIPLFYTGKAIYINEDFKGVYIADGGNLIYFYAGEEN